MSPSTDQLRGRVLLVSHNFPPTIGPESSLVRLNTIDLVNRGWDVTVLTTTSTHIHQKMDQNSLLGLPEGLCVMRTPSWEAVFRRRFPRFGSLTLSFLIHLVPEIFLTWALSAVPAGLRWLNDNGPSIIYSRATKHVSNVAGLWIKKRTGLPWIAHFSDPWLGYPMNSIQIWLGRQIEKRIFAEADAVVTVSRQLASHFAGLYPLAASKIVVIPHGYEKKLESIPATPKCDAPRVLTILHAGSFMPGLREPTCLFRGLSHLAKRLPLHGRIMVTLVGDDTRRYQEMADEFGISDLVELSDSLPFHECQKKVSSSDVLLVIDTPGFEGVFLPTKLIEYLAHRKPVIGITEHGSAVHDVLQECGLSFADIQDPESIANVFEKMLALWSDGDLDSARPCRESAESYAIENVNRKLDDLVLTLSSKL
jgi:glycosyltransferase involved in cell wall biosynthesis